MLATNLVDVGARAYFVPGVLTINEIKNVRQIVNAGCASDWVNGQVLRNSGITALARIEKMIERPMRD